MLKYEGSKRDIRLSLIEWLVFQLEYLINDI